MYCKVQGFEGKPEEMLKYDGKRYPPCVRETKFGIWLRERWAKFCELNRGVNLHSCCPQVNEAFDKWLAESVK